MKSLQERQKERALRAAAAAKGEDISSMLETQELIDAKQAQIDANNAVQLDTFVQPQFAVGPVRQSDPVGAGVDKRILGADGEILVDGDPASKDKPSEAKAKVSAATVKQAEKTARAAESVGTWTANTPAAAKDAKA